MMWKMVCGAVLFASCFALHAASVPAFRWVKSFGGAGYDVIKAVAVDHNSGICIVGASSGDSTIAPRDNAARFDFSGELIWATQLGTSGARVVDLSVDGLGKFYALCATSGTNTIAGLRVENAARTTCGIIVTLDHHGKALNAVLLQGGEEFEPFALRVDAAGHCFWSGYCHGYTDAGKGTTVPRTIIGKTSPKGRHLWHYTIKATKRSYATIGIDPSANVYVLGDSEGGAQLDGLGTSGAPGPNAFLAKLDATGHPLWVRHFGVGAKVGATRLAVDLEGACIVSGYAQGAARIENLVVGSAAKPESYYLAAKYLPDGSVAWARDLAYVKDLKPGDVCTDLGGNAYFTHTLDGAAVSILKLGRGGDVQWEKRYTFSSLPGRRTFLQASREGFVYLAGDYYSNVDLDGRTLTSRGYSDIFVALLEATTSPWDFVRPNPITKPVATMPVVNPPSIQAPIASNAMIIPTSRGRMYITK